MNKYELYYRVAQSQLLEQAARNQQLELKAGITIGFSGTIIGLAAFTIGLWNAWSILIAVIMSIAFFWTSGFAIAVLWVSNWERRPALSELSEHLANYADDKLAQWVGDAYSKSFTLNEVVLNNKAEMLVLSFFGLAAEGILVGVLLFSTKL